LPSAFFFDSPKQLELKGKGSAVSTKVICAFYENEAAGPEDRLDRIRLIVSDFNNYNASFQQMFRSTGRDSPIGIQPIRPAIERCEGIEIPDFALK